jgi:WD40 repeat protein
MLTYALGVCLWAGSFGLSPTPIMSLAEIDSEVREVHVDDDGSICAALGSDGGVSLWDPRSAALIASIHSHHRASCIRLVTDSSTSTPLIAMATRVDDEECSHTRSSVMLWDVRNMHEACAVVHFEDLLSCPSHDSFHSSSHTDGVLKDGERQICMDSDGKTFVIGTPHGNIYSGTFDGGSETELLMSGERGSSSAVTCLRVLSLQCQATRDVHSTILTGSIDGSCAILDLP